MHTHTRTGGACVGRVCPARGPWRSGNGGHTCPPAKPKGCGAAHKCLRTPRQQGGHIHIHTFLPTVHQHLAPTRTCAGHGRWSPPGPEPPHHMPTTLACASTWLRLHAQPASRPAGQPAPPPWRTYLRHASRPCPARAHANMSAHSPPHARTCGEHARSSGGRRSTSPKVGTLPAGRPWLSL
jgi:hypothetical protein